MKFKTWLDENYPYRNRNYKQETLYAKSKYDETYLENELLEIYEDTKQHLIDIMQEDEKLGLYDVFNEEKKKGVKDLINKYKQDHE
jgi:hypothetical protein